MGYELDAILVRQSDLRRLKLKSAIIFPLTPELALIPMTEDLAEEIDPLEDWAEEASEGILLARLTADFWGGVGGHDCTIWDGGESETGLDINQVLPRFGVQPKSPDDAFDTVGLGRHRRNETWAAHAILDPIQDSVDALIEKLPFACKDAHVQEEVRSIAAARLGKLKAVRAVEALKRTLSDPEYGTRLSAASALAEIGAPGIPVLLEALQTKEPWGIVFALGKIGPAARGTAPALVPLLRHAEWQIRLEVIQTLAAIGADLSPVEPLLNDPVELVRNAARKALNG